MCGVSQVNKWLLKTLKKVTLTISKSKAGTKAARYEHRLDCKGNSLSRQKRALDADTSEKPIGMKRTGKLTQARVYHCGGGIRLNWLRFPLSRILHVLISVSDDTVRSAGTLLSSATEGH